MATRHDTPKGFKKWVKDHKEQIQGVKNPPYWVRNNKDVVNGVWWKKKDDAKVNIIANPQKRMRMFHLILSLRPL